MSKLTSHIFNTAEVKYIEHEYAKQHNGHCYDLMEKAGRSAYSNIMKRFPRIKEVWIFCGKGNNGGDGYVVASCFLKKGISHRVFAVGLPKPGTEAGTAYQFYLASGGHVESEFPRQTQQRPDVIVDALLGTGISSAPREPVNDWILFINRCHCFCVAIDVPSGVAADSGNVPGDCVKADLTVCMLSLKPGLFTGAAVDYVGEIIFESLDVDCSKYYGRLNGMEGVSELPILLRDYDDIKEDLPIRERSSNKGDNGKVLIIGGSKGMGGAAIISGLGALRSGAGLVKVALDNVNISALNAVCPELMSVDLNDREALERAIEWAEIIAIGPGLSQNANAQRVLALVESSDKYAVYDADALNLIAKSAKNGVIYSDYRIMTPHPGEAARLLDVSVDTINQNRLDSARLLQQRFGGIVLLKGAGTVICNGKRLSIINEGSPAMATGGMGDLLTGITASLLSRGLTPYQATVCAACVHGRAGFLAGKDGGIIGTLPTDLIPYIRKLVNQDLYE
ncbi:MAG TPA: bifunctional ADP-dependent NAD(P)H-hydrate dehydratase/NAD(P)H-hydrate epimerase [Succinivibrionaceae bacterium]|nr:bifunctional ADP-dependent NAD(P)H-hydrate dehydratase/NAD(P)H-hydrate epimerase [Succinivibrionaceae bacterium]